MNINRRRTEKANIYLICDKTNNCHSVISGTVTEYGTIISANTHFKRISGTSDRIIRGFHGRGWSLADTDLLLNSLFHLQFDFAAGTVYVDRASLALMVNNFTILAPPIRRISASLHVHGLSFLGSDLMDHPQQLNLFRHWFRASPLTNVRVISVYMYVCMYYYVQIFICPWTIGVCRGVQGVQVHRPSLLLKKKICVAFGYHSTRKIQSSWIIGCVRLLIQIPDAIDEPASVKSVRIGESGWSHQQPNDWCELKSPLPNAPIVSLALHTYLW